MKNVGSTINPADTSLKNKERIMAALRNTKIPKEKRQLLAAQSAFYFATKLSSDFIKSYLMKQGRMVCPRCGLEIAEQDGKLVHLKGSDICLLLLGKELAKDKIFDPYEKPLCHLMCYRNHRSVFQKCLDEMSCFHIECLHDRSPLSDDKPSG